MLDATYTLFFIIGFLVLFSIVMPLVARITKISFTWTLVIVYLGILFGVILDFSHLTNEVRMILAIGSILVSVAYILSHVSEKARARGEQMRLPEMHVKKGNTHVNVKFSDARKIMSDEEDPVDLMIFPHCLIITMTLQTFRIFRRMSVLECRISPCGTHMNELRHKKILIQ